MNKKIYFNDKFIEFIVHPSQDSQNQSIRIHDLAGSENANFFKKTLPAFLDFLNSRSIAVINYPIEDLITYFKTNHYYIEAAGGFIQKADEFLFIHRHGRWDLPKGKLEKNESIESAAVRECEEECGVKALVIKSPMASTFHIYQYKKSFALKQTFWFHMHTNYSEALVPQAEEDIDQVKWFGRKDIENMILKDTYYTITDVINEGLQISQ